MSDKRDIDPDDRSISTSFKKYASPDGAGVSFYGRHPEASQAAQIKAPLMLNHAGLDERVNASWPDFESGLKNAGIDYVHHDYERVQHGFHNDTTPRYDEKAAELAWQRTVQFFGDHLRPDG